MSPAPANSTTARWTNIILIAICAVLLWLPTLDTFFHFDHTPPFKEKRVLARFPQFKSGLGGLKKYVAGLEACFNDHFGYRNRLIFWHTKWTHDFLRSSSVPKVLIGKDGWLFWAGDQMVEHYRGVNQFTPQELEDWKTLLEHRRDWLAQRGIKYIFVIAPDKQSIYPEYLPDWMTKVRLETKLDQFFAYMHSHSTVEVLDLRPALRDAKKTAPTYFKNDAHWNFFGGFLACHEIATELSKQMPGIKPLSLDSFELKNTTRNFGDLEMFLGMDLTDDKAVSLNPKPSLPVLGMSEQVESQQGSFFSTNPVIQGNAIVFRDSFAFFMEPYLGYHFGKVSYIWRQGLKAESIESEKPIVVISEMVERNFNVRDPKELMKLEVLK
jgi:alginate O-acetyltransferase complex protein AlgJ